MIISGSGTPDVLSGSMAEPERPRTLEEVGLILGVTRERVRQIEAKALRKLRHPSRSRVFKDFY